MIATDEYAACFISWKQQMPEAATPAEMNLWIKERIRLYVETWVLPPLNQALEKVMKSYH